MFNQGVKKSPMNTKFAIGLVSTLLISLAQLSVAQEVILEDEGVSMTLEEVEYIVGKWPGDWQKAAAADPGDRIELLNIMLSNKKLAAEAAKVSVKEDPERYWHQQLVIRNTLRNFAVNNYMADLEIPDMKELAAERYQTEKDKYAAVPESRLTSHILFRCTYAECEPLQEVANKVLAELESGASFGELAAQYSEDPGSKDKGGRYDRWLLKSDTDVDAYYLQAAFDLKAEGDIAKFQSGFGIHIIRLDEQKAKHYLPYEDVSQDIEASLVQEYQKLAAKEFDAKFMLTDEAFIDTAAMDRIFAPYRDAPVDPPQSMEEFEGPLSEAISVEESAP